MSMKMEEPRNEHEKTLACFVLDHSYSMIGNNIDSLNEGMAKFIQEIKKDGNLKDRLEIAIISFDNNVKVTSTPDLAEYITFNKLVASGSTAMIDAMYKAVEIVEERKDYYKTQQITYKRPWIVLITDGEPDGGQDIDGFSQLKTQKDKQKAFTIFSLAVEGANVSILEKVSTLPVVKLDGARFAQFFKWLSNSMGMIVGTDGGDVDIRKGMDSFMVATY